MRTLIAALMLSVLLPSSALAGLHVCNKSNSNVDVAVAGAYDCQELYQGGPTGCNYFVYGWWTIAPGDCAVVLEADLDPDNDYFVHGWSQTTT